MRAIRSFLFCFNFLKLDEDQPIRRYGIAHLDVDVLYLGIVRHKSGMDERVERTLENVIEVAPATVRREELPAQPDFAIELPEQPTEARNAHHAKTTTLAADKHTRADVTVISIDARRPGKLETYCLTHGAPCGCAVGVVAAPAATAGVATDPTFAL